MLTLSAKIRKITGKKVKTLRGKGVLPGVLYGPKIKTALPLEIDLKEFEKVYHEAGESSLIFLEVADPEGEQAPYGAGKKYPVLIHEVDRDPLTEKLIHVDFYQPRLEEEVEVTIPIIFEGEAPAVKELGGTLVRNISEIKVKAIPTELPKELRIEVSELKTFEAHILVKDLVVPKGVKILRNPDEILAWVSPSEKVEEELVKPVEEKVEEVKKVEEKKEEGEI